MDFITSISIEANADLWKGTVQVLMVNILKDSAVSESEH